MAVIGVRGVTVLSLVLTAAALLVSSLAREIWQLTMFFGLLSGLGSGLVASVLGTDRRQPLVHQGSRARRPASSVRASAPASSSSSRC